MTLRGCKSGTCSHEPMCSLPRGGWDSSLFSPGTGDVGQYIHVQGLLGQSTTHWVAWNNRNVLSHCPGGQKSEAKVPTQPCPSEALGGLLPASSSFRAAGSSGRFWACRCISPVSVSSVTLSSPLCVCLRLLSSR